MSEKQPKLIDPSRSFEYFYEGQSDDLEIYNCLDHTYSFLTDEEDRYIFLVQEFPDCDLIGLKFYRAADYESTYRYNILTNHRNPFRFFSTIVNILNKEVLIKFPHHSIIFIGEPTIKELKLGEALTDTRRRRFYIYLLSHFISSRKYDLEPLSMNAVLYKNRHQSEKNISNIISFLASYGFHL